jgi:hypothetical protein
LVFARKRIIAAFQVDRPIAIAGRDLAVWQNAKAGVYT